METDSFISIDWADVDADGDLDLAAASYGGPLRLYQNEAGALSLLWTSTEVDEAASIAWGDCEWW